MNDPLIQLFIGSLKLDAGLSPLTLEAYSKDLNQFLASEKTPLLERKEKDIETYLGLLRKKEHAPSSVARKVSALRQFYKFLIRENLIKEDPTLFVSTPKNEQKLPETLDEGAISALLLATDEGLPYGQELGPALRIRDQAMIYFLYATGMRITELLSLPIHKVDLNQGLVRIFGKRSKERIVPFARVAGEKIQNYLADARPLLKPNTDILFIGRTGEALTRQAFSKTLKRLAVLAGIPSSLHAHMLRHTFATDLLRSGMNLRTLQTLLGHQDLQTTQIYTHVAPDRLKEVIDRYHPRGSGKPQPKAKK